jgi:hypothetical protein
MNLPDSPVAEMPRPAAATMKFTYASGSRPLDGYTIKRGVGRGGFGEVYFATSDAGKEVALKLIRRNMDVELRGATQCLNLKHPNLIGLYDIRTDEMGDQWIIMEYVSGESLEDVIERNPKGMPIDQVLAWMRGLCAGVAYLHDHGIVHRDLKPGNIFVDEGTVKIGDYGLAKFISCSRRSGQTESVGTVHYMAPEIANGRYGREIDTYALGIILFEVLTGTVPFEGESVGEVLMKHLTAEPDLTRLADPYRDIVRRALAKDPEVRLKNVGEMVALMPGGNVATDAGVISDVALTPIRPPAVRPGSPGPEAGSPKATVPLYAREAPIGPIEEPIWKAIRGAAATFGRAWRSGDIHPLAKAGIIFGLVVLVFSGGVFALAAIGIPVLICYAIYYLLWMLFIRPGIERQTLHYEAPPYGEAASAAGAARPSPASANWRIPAEPLPVAASPSSSAERYAQKVRRRRLRANWRDRANRELLEKPLRVKLRELSGSMLLASLLVMMISLVAPIVGVGSPVTYLWLAVVGTLGSWAVLVPAKFTEGKLEDHVPMRLVMLLLGGLVGAAAWGIGNALLVSLPSAYEPLDAGWGLISHELLGWPQPPSPRSVGSNPPFAAYVTFFATLFVVVRWWRRADYIRPTRLSLWSVAGCVTAAWLVHLFWWFPQPAGMMVAGTVAAATQLASPWMPPSRRRELSEEIDRGA